MGRSVLVNQGLLHSAARTHVEALRFRPTPHFCRIDLTPIRKRWSGARVDTYRTILSVRPYLVSVEGSRNWCGFRESRDSDSGGCLRRIGDLPVVGEDDDLKAGSQVMKNAKCVGSANIVKRHEDVVQHQRKGVLTRCDSFAVELGHRRESKR